MLVRGMDTCSEMDEKGGLSLSAAEQDIGHSSRQRDTIESTTTCVRETRVTHRVNRCQNRPRRCLVIISLQSAAGSQQKQRSSTVTWK